jgi:hypothetical protein
MPKEHFPQNSFTSGASLVLGTRDICPTLELPTAKGLRKDAAQLAG